MVFSPFVALDGNELIVVQSGGHGAAMVRVEIAARVTALVARRRRT
jgi:hypothetical protein